MPFGVIGTVWSYRSLRETAKPQRAPIDWWGNVTFALGLVLVMIGITYGIRPYGGSNMGWRSPFVDGCLIGGVALLGVLRRRRAAEPRNPMFRLPLFRIRAFTFGVLSSFLSAVARGGLMFMLIIWLQGIWLPEHGYNFSQTPLWAGLYMLPLTVGFLVAGPISGYLSDRHGSRLLATGGHDRLGDRLRPARAAPDRLRLPGLRGDPAADGPLDGRVRVAQPRRRDEQPARRGDRGAGAGMNQTFQNSAQVLSIGIFFTLMIIGLSATLPHTLTQGLEAHGVPAATATQIGNLPPVSVLFAAFLGYNPITHLDAGARARRTSTPSQTTALERPQLLPAPDRRPVPLRPARGVRVRDHRLPDRRCRLVVARRALRPHRAAAPTRDDRSRLESVATVACAPAERAGEAVCGLLVDVGDDRAVHE